MEIHIRHTVATRPSLPFEAVARYILGDRYELSLTICGDKLSRRMNKTYRNKSYAPNVLSFPYDAHEGEIFLNPGKARREAKKFGRTYMQHLALLFVHGCLHLKGLDHGTKMEKLEQQALKKFHLA